MNVFSAVEGLRPEELTSAMLRVLVESSDVVRSIFLDLVSEPGFEPISAGRQFACETERHAEEADEGGEIVRGRIDLLLECENAVIGVENKLFAGFQDDQPWKYLKHIRDRARQLAKERGCEVRPILVILYPRVQEGKIKEHLQTRHKEGKEPRLIHWEDLTQRLSVVDAFDTRTAVLAAEFCDYLKSKIGFLNNWDEILRKLDRWHSGHSEHHRTVVQTLAYHLTDLFPNFGKFATGGGSIGYSFNFVSTDDSATRGWLGFIKGSEIVECDPEKAALVVILPSALGFRGAPDLTQVLLRNGDWYGVPLDAWTIDYDESWGHVSRWQDTLQTILDAGAGLAPPPEPPGRE